jgi:hypothetical protein
MNKSHLPLIFFMTFIISTGVSGVCTFNSESLKSDKPLSDTLPDNQLLYIGREWKNLYYMVKKDQFLFSNEFLPGSVSMNGKTFPGIYIRYDIFKDELLTLHDRAGILQFNKEMVDSFSIFFQNKTYKFTRVAEDSSKVLKGYVDVIYKGKTALYVKYLKTINRSAVEGEYDKFYQERRIYFVKDNLAYLIKSRNDLFNVMDEEKTQIKDFMKKNRIKVLKREAESFIPVIRYYDRISH